MSLISCGHITTTVSTVVIITIIQSHTYVHNSTVYICS
nr:MAG TPA: hypothetical protein [Caudoviricetes sp.]